MKSISKIAILCGGLICFAGVYGAPALKTMRVQSSMISKTLRAQGTIEAQQDVLLSTQQTGTIAAIYFHNGQFVKRGAPLYALNSNELHAQLIQAQTKAKLSQLQWQRMQTLAKQTTGSVSQSTLDQSQATAKQDAAQVNYYQVQIAQRIIRAPFAGTTGKSLVSLGSYVEPGDHLVRLLSNLNLTANYTLPSESMPDLKLKQPVTIASLQPPMAKSAGQLSYISSFINQSSRTISLQATLLQPQAFTPGQFVAITQTLNQQKKVIRIPVSALMTGLQGPYVYVLSKQKPQVRFVQADINGTYADVTKGLHAGDVIVTQGQSSLQNN